MIDKHLLIKVKTFISYIKPRRWLNICTHSVSNSKSSFTVKLRIDNVRLIIIMQSNDKIYDIMFVMLPGNKELWSK